MVATTAATTGAVAASSSAAAAGTATAAGATTATTAAAGTATAGTAAAGASSFSSWLTSALFGTAEASAANSAATTTASTLGSTAATTATTGTGSAATSGLIGAGGEFSTKSLIANTLTGASATSAVMGGVSMGRTMKAAEKQAKIQYGQEKLKGTQKSNLIRESMLNDASAAKASFAARGISSAGTPMQVIGEGANQANQDVGIVSTDAKLNALQLKAMGNEYRRASPFSLLSGVGNAASIVGNRIISK